MPSCASMCNRTEELVWELSAKLSHLLVSAVSGLRKSSSVHPRAAMSGMLVTKTRQEFKILRHIAHQPYPSFLLYRSRLISRRPWMSMSATHRLSSPSPEIIPRTAPLATKPPKTGNCRKSGFWSQNTRDHGA